MRSKKTTATRLLSTALIFSMCTLTLSLGCLSRARFAGNLNAALFRTGKVMKGIMVND